MMSTDYLRCENCGRPTTEESVAASASLDAWVGGPFCSDCVRLARRLVDQRLDGDDLFDARP